MMMMMMMMVVGDGVGMRRWRGRRRGAKFAILPLYPNFMATPSELSLEFGLCLEAENHGLGIGLGHVGLGLGLVGHGLGLGPAASVGLWPRWHHWFLIVLNLKLPHLYYQGLKIPTASIHVWLNCALYSSTISQILPQESAHCAWYPIRNGPQIVFLCCTYIIWKSFPP